MNAEKTPANGSKWLFPHNTKKVFGLKPFFFIERNYLLLLLTETDAQSKF